MRVLSGCATSDLVRREFERLGHDAWQCDLLPTEGDPEKHLLGDVRDFLHMDWDLAIFHPTCTRMTNAGSRWLKVPPPGRTLEEMWEELDQGTKFFSELWNCAIPKIAVENPIMHYHAKERIQNYERQAQTSQPWHFGDPFFKGICWWLKDLPNLKDTNRLDPPKKGTEEHKKWSAVHLASPGPNRWKERSRLFPGIAKAMAEQWAGAA